MLENIVLKMVNNTVLFEHDAAVDVLCVIECFISQSFNFQFMMLFSKTHTHIYKHIQPIQLISPLQTIPSW